MLIPARRMLALSLAGALVLASCATDPQAPGPDATPPATTRAGPSAPAETQPLDCERIGYPCDLADTPPELLQRNLDLLAAAGERLAVGTMADALAFLRVEPDVVEAFGSDLAVTFRIEGAPPAWLVDQSNVRPGETSRSPRPASPTSGIVPMPDIELASVVGDDTTGNDEIDNRDDKRALVLAPYMWQFSPYDESDHVAERLETMKGYEGNVRLRANRTQDSQEVTVDDWRSFDQYDAIFISTHGHRECDLVDGAYICRTIVMTGINSDQFDAQVGGLYRGFMPIGVYDEVNGTTHLDFELGIASDGFRMLYPDGLNDTLLSLSACETGLITGDELAAAMSPGGDDFVMLAWTEAVPLGAAFKASGVLIEQLSLGLTSEQAYQAVIEAGFGSAVNREGDVAALEHISPGGAEVRLVELPTLELNGEPMRDGANLSARVIGAPGDFESDKLRLDLRLIGIHDKSRYSVRYEVDGDPTDGPHDLFFAREGDLPYSYVVQHEVDVGFGVPKGEMELTAIVELPEGGESRYSVKVNVGDEASAVVTVGGQTWEFVLADGWMGCSLSQDGSQLIANGSVGDAFEVRLSAALHPFGVGTSERLASPASASVLVIDGVNNKTWMADATDPVGMVAAIEAIPGGSSQIDTLTIEGSHAWGTATFIETGAVFTAWSTHGPLPPSVPGTFDIRCAG